MSTRVRATLVLAAFVCACAGPPASPPLPTQGEWTAARAWLSDLRATEPTRPFGAVVHVALHEPRSGRTFSARGAIAVDPHHSLRMILVGPAGATALDVWATPERWRFEVPAAKILRRGGRENDASLPIGFFRWWFLGPLDGRLLTSVTGAASERFILRDGAATVDLTDARVALGHAVAASRLANGTIDSIAFRGRSFAVAPGDRAVYDQRSSGVHVEVDVESPSDTPDPSAFLDPDSPEGQKASGS